MKGLKAIKSIIFVVASFIIGGCGTTVIDLDNPEEKAGMSNVMALEYRDFEKAANAAVQDMLNSGALKDRSGGRYVLAISRVTNDTMQRIDTDQLIKQIRTQLLQSGKVVVTSAIGVNEAEDPMVMKARELRNSKEFDQKNVAKPGTIVAPDISLSGKIIQRNLALDFGGERVEYYFQLTLTDLSTGLAIWEGETPIIKEGKKAPIW